MAGPVSGYDCVAGCRLRPAQRLDQPPVEAALEAAPSQISRLSKPCLATLLATLLETLQPCLATLLAMLLETLLLQCLATLLVASIQTPASVQTPDPTIP